MPAGPLLDGHDAMTRRAIYRILISAALCLSAGLLAATGAQAHAELVASDPPDGAHLAAVPSQVTLTFSEEVAVGECAVQANGENLPLHGQSGHPTVVVADLTGIHAHVGDLALVWRSVSSDDGHVANGSLHYFLPVGPANSSATTPAAAAARTTAAAPAPAAGATTATTVPGPDPAVKDALTGVRILGFATTALFVGGLVFIAAVWPLGGTDRRSRRLLAASWALGLLTALAEIPLQAGYDALRPLSGVWDSSAISDLLAGRLGAELVAKALLWTASGVVLAALLQRAERAAVSAGWRVGVAAVGFGLLRLTGMPGHDDTAHPLAGAIADTVHLTGAALWIGGLALLLIGVLPRRRPDELAVVVRRFSNLALV